MSAPMGESAPWLSRGTLAVLGTGAALPGAPVSTQDLIGLMVQRFGFTREREAGALAERLGVRSRHICRTFTTRAEVAHAGQSNPDLAARAVRAALSDAGLKIGDIAYLIGHTATPLQSIPPNIALVADRLGYAGPHLELRQACTGFANALMIAFGLLARADSRPVVIVGSETGSLFFDPQRMAEDSGQVVNMIQMGDASGAVVLGPTPRAGAAIKASWFGAIGLDRAPGLQMHHGATEFDHDFSAILAAGGRLFDAGRDAAALQGAVLERADVIIPHQVSGRIGDQAAAHFGLPRARIFVNADRVGNTGSAAIWLALAELRAGSLESGARVVALGAEATKFMYGGFVYDHG